MHLPCLQCFFWVPNESTRQAFASSSEVYSDVPLPIRGMPVALHEILCTTLVKGRATAFMRIAWHLLTEAVRKCVHGAQLIARRAAARRQQRRRDAPRRICLGAPGAQGRLVTVGDKTGEVVQNGAVQRRNRVLRSSTGGPEKAPDRSAWSQISRQCLGAFSCFRYLPLRNGTHQREHGCSSAVQTSASCNAWDANRHSVAWHNMHGARGVRILGCSTGLQAACAKQ